MHLDGVVVQLSYDVVEVHLVPLHRCQFRILESRVSPFADWVADFWWYARENGFEVFFASEVGILLAVMQEFVEFLNFVVECLQLLQVVVVDGFERFEILQELS